jgi:hypothetical protein
MCNIREDWEQEAGSRKHVAGGRLAPNSETYSGGRRQIAKSK